MKDESYGYSLASNTFVKASLTFRKDQTSYGVVLHTAPAV